MGSDLGRRESAIGGAQPVQRRTPLFPAPKTLIVAVILIQTLLLDAGGALAQPVTCGQVITQDTKLDSDLLDCPGHGIVIGADNITLDLNGHTIDGFQRDWPFDFGIDNTAGHVGVTIRNGTVREFDTGVALDGAINNHVEALTVSTTISGAGISILNGSNSNRIEKNALSGNGSGTYLQWSEFNVIAQNSVTGNDVAFSLFGSHFNLFEKNLVSQNSRGFYLLESDGNRMTQNTVIDHSAGGFGIYDHSDDNVIERNLVSNNGFGISLSDTYRRPGARRNLILKNDVYDNTFNGIFLQGPSNDPEFPSPGATETIVEGNCVDGNGDDGIDVRNPTNTLTKNRVNNNADLGIEAVPDVTDGGGNRAYGNGNLLQCLNVACGSPSSPYVPDRPSCSARSKSVPT